MQAMSLEQARQKKKRPLSKSESCYNAIDLLGKVGVQNGAKDMNADKEFLRFLWTTVCIRQHTTQSPNIHGDNK